MHFSDAVKPEFFERNFAWHAITQFEDNLEFKKANTSVMFLKPVGSTKDRMGKLKTTFDLKTAPEISTAFYFDLILNALISVK